MECTSKLSTVLSGRVKRMYNGRRKNDGTYWMELTWLWLRSIMDDVSSAKEERYYTCTLHLRRMFVRKIELPKRRSDTRSYMLNGCWVDRSDGVDWQHPSLAFLVDHLWLFALSLSIFRWSFLSFGRWTRSSQPNEDVTARLALETYVPYASGHPRGEGLMHVGTC